MLQKINLLLLNPHLLRIYKCFDNNKKKIWQQITDMYRYDLFMIGMKERLSMCEHTRVSHNIYMLRDTIYELDLMKHGLICVQIRSYMIVYYLIRFMSDTDIDINDHFSRTICSYFNKQFNCVTILLFETLFTIAFRHFNLFFNLRLKSPTTWCRPCKNRSANDALLFTQWIWIVDLLTMVY